MAAGASSTAHAADAAAAAAIAQANEEHTKHKTPKLQNPKLKTQLKITKPTNHTPKTQNIKLKHSHTQAPPSLNPNIHAFTKPHCVYGGLSPRHLCAVCRANIYRANT